jgi:hypothetical protein
MIKKAIIKLIITCFIPCLGYSQDLKTVFLDSIDINHYIAKAFVVDTVIMKSEYSIRINLNDKITVFGNLDQMKRPNGKWIFTFNNDLFEYVKGNFHKGKRDGTWYIGCGAGKLYKKGKVIRVTMCPF